MTAETMVWFKVDDKLHSHPKTSNCSLAAMGLWTLAGSWCGDQTTDGRIPLTMIQSLSRGAVELADELVAAGFWVRVKDGYRFHQWLADGNGTKRNPSKKEVEEARRIKAEAGRKGGLASGKTRSKREASAKAGASTLVEPPTRPDPPPSKEGGEGSRAPRFAHGAARSTPQTPPPPPAPNGSMPNQDQRAALAAAARNNIRKKPPPSRDQYQPPPPDKAQAALDALDQAVANLTPPPETPEQP